MGQNKSSPLLYRELSRLSPDIFSHPVWVHYIPIQENPSANLVQLLHTQVRQFITNNDPNSACQVLFLCAALEKFRGDYPAALAFIQQAGALAEQHNLAEAGEWAAWGACSLFMMQGQYELAADNLRKLREDLIGSYNWILAGILEVLELALTEKAGDDYNLDPVLEWLREWGRSPAEIQASHDLIGTSNQIFSQKRESARNKNLSASLTAHFLLILANIARITTGKVHLEQGMNVEQKAGKAPISKDILMDTFWPDAGPDSARNRLHVAMHGLRQVLRSVSNHPIVIFEGDAYGLSQNLNLWVDTEAFEQSLQKANEYEARGLVDLAVKNLVITTSLYQGDFLEDDPYEDWPVLTRERLRVAYLDALDRLSRIYYSQGQHSACINLCHLILIRDNCREDAHCRLMRCYSKLEQPYLALRQFQACVEALRNELDIDPQPATIQLAQRIRNHEGV